MEDGKRPQMKEKILTFYDRLFRGEDPSKTNVGFWDEFFLLWANVSALDRELASLTPQQLLELKPILNLIIRKCIATIEEERNVRAVNAMQTLSCVVRNVVRRTSQGFGFDIIDLLFGFDHAEPLMKGLTERLCEFLTEDFPPSLKFLSLQVLLTIATSADNISQNTVMEYLLINSVFEALIEILGSPVLKQEHGDDCVLLLTLLANYRKYEGVNPYIVKLSILDDELALTGLSHVISLALGSQNRRYQEKVLSGEPQGVLSSITNMVGNMFVAEDVALEDVKTDESLLLSMYEMVHLNRNFLTTLTSLPTDGGRGAESGGKQADYQSNLLVSFLTYCSVVMQDLKTERSRKAGKLCAIVLTCIAEDEYANTLMHDVNMSFRVPLYRAPMRHRKGAFDRNPPLRPLACTVLDLTVEFVLSHMMKNLPMELYLWILGVMQRILCYEKKCRVRLHYCWRDLWNALITLLKFIVQNESVLMPTVDIFPLCQKVMTLLNFFVTFGDTFLPSPATYDHLYYEIIRQAEAFENLYSMVLRYLNGTNKHKDSATRLANQLANCRAIVSHFQPKMEQIGASSTQEQVLDIVREHYDTLTLKLYENLDVYERYNEKPRETSFFVHLVKLIVSESRQKLQKVSLDHNTVLSELSILHPD